MGSRINFDSSINAWTEGIVGFFKASLLSSNETDPLSASVFTQTSEPRIEIIIKSKKNRAYSRLSPPSNLYEISL